MCNIELENSEERAEGARKHVKRTPSRFQVEMEETINIILAKDLNTGSSLFLSPCSEAVIVKTQRCSEKESTPPKNGLVFPGCSDHKMIRVFNSG